MRSTALLGLVLLVACSSDPSPETPPPEKKHPPRHTWDDDEIQRIDFPEATTNPPAPAAGTAPAAAAPRRVLAKLALSAYDVISWDDVKIRGAVRGSPVRGVVSLTGWLKGAKASERAELTVERGKEAALDVPEGLRDLLGGEAGFRVLLLDANDPGALELALTPLAAASEEAPVSVATRVKLGPGEAVVLGGHRREEGETGGKKDRLVLLEATRAP
jgi:hypothetical protein